ncbi:M20 family peptidase [Microbulbifer agarilyticus]|uniref:M20 family peptidase n=1 Tax=Microbulbifer agarilyticus TaxID=260552 RepID=UPI001C94B485|nr:M20 family peptidase [Microbulbifer agarilyticus]MBY6210349.1 M20 family peptidase [Microbulbifer agarilyticus]
MKKRIVGLLGAGIVLVVAIASVRAVMVYPDRQLVIENPQPPLALDAEQAAQRLADVIRFPTITQDEAPYLEPQPFIDFHNYLEAQYPAVTAFATRHVFNKYSLVYEFPGTNPELKPILLMGHMDVVSVDEDTLSDWTHPPFAGVISDGQIWGRGAIDNKASVMALMEAMEHLLQTGAQPERSIFFSFGHDEEIGGENGAAEIARYFASRDLNFEFVLDEGGAITEGLMPGFEQPIAVIGVAEKGFVNVRLVVEQPGGHSSKPPASTGAGILARAIVQLEDNQFPTTLKFTNMTFDAVGHYAGFGARFGMANQWLTGPLVESAILANESSASGIRTSTAATMLKGSSKSNILPTRASAVVNFRIMPGETAESVVTRVRSVIDDPRVSIEPFMASNPSPVSSIDAYGYRLIEKNIRELDPNVLVAPYLVQGGTDSKHFYGLSDAVYRFLMVRVTPETVNTFHGIDERLGVEDFANGIRFFVMLLEQSSFPDKDQRGGEATAKAH